MPVHAGRGSGMTGRFLEELTAGLRATPKRVASRFFYDDRGSQLFDQITQLDDYYLTRCELQILRDAAKDITAGFGEQVTLIELGSGSSTKVECLVDATPSVTTYIPVDICQSALDRAVTRLARSHPDLRVQPVHADFKRDVVLPPLNPSAQWVVFYPGSTIGNAEPGDVDAILGRITALLRPGDRLLIGVDLVKDVEIMERAYNDAEGINAVFHKNLLRHLNRLAGADFVPDQFQHVARFNAAAGRVEMQLRSLQRQQVSIGGEVFTFEVGELLHTESSYKFELEAFHRSVGAHRLDHVRTWLDDQGWFAVVCYERPDLTPSRDGRVRETP